MGKLLSIIILFLIVISARAYAINMGTVVKNDFSKINVDESAKFKVLFWNVENEPYQIKIDIREVPKDWIVIVYPELFSLNSSVGNENIKLPYEDGYTKATSVDVIVKPANYTKPGKYNIILTAKSLTPQNGISISQERMFTLTVEVENPLYFEEKNEQKASAPKPQQSQNQIQGNFLITNSSNQFYAIIIFITLVISFLIYRYL
jgi:uncharacterized membrane protein